MAKIHEQIPKIMADVGHISKDKKNAAQGYSFRGIDDVYEAAQLVMAKHGVFPVPEVLEERTEERVTPKGSLLIYRVLKMRYTLYADDGSSISAIVIGEGMDSGDKASNKAMSVAEKYAFLQILMIPTREAKDPEEDSHEVAPKEASLGYDPQNRNHQDWLIDNLKARKIPDVRWDDVGNAFKGRQKQDLNAVLDLLGL